MPSKMPALVPIDLNLTQQTPARRKIIKALTKGDLTTGRKILVYPPGTLSDAVRSLSKHTSLKPASIASVRDMGSATSSSVNEFFQNTTGTVGMTFEGLDTIVVKDLQSAGGLSPASIGGTGHTPIVGDDYYVFPASQGPTSNFVSIKIEDLKQILDQLQGIILQSTSASTMRPASVGDPGAQQTWALKAVKAMSSPFTGKNVRIAVIDTGIDAAHPDLKDKIAGTFSFEGIDGGDVRDEMGHGTHVAGTIAGSRSSPLAYAIAPNAQLFIAQVFKLNSATPSSTLNVIAAIEWALGKNCHIANMSLSSEQPLPSGIPFDATFEALAQNALKKNLLLVAAAGNCADMDENFNHIGVRNSPPAPVGIPANCPSVLAVGALTSDLQIAAFSNAGQSDPSDGQVSFSAPGVDIVSAWPTYLTPEAPVEGLSGPYGLLSGTSQASPHIAGLAALICEKLGGTSGLQLWQALAAATVDPLSGLARIDVGFGMLLAPQS